MRLRRVQGTRRVTQARRVGTTAGLGFACLILSGAPGGPVGPESYAGTGPALLAAGLDTVSAATSLPTQLAIAPELLARLQVLADALHKEIVLCLYGDVRGDSARLTRLTMPRPLRSEPDQARFGPCPPEALAVWHNHPVPPPGFRAPRPVTDTDPTGLCRLSATDVRTAAGAGHPFTVVSVDGSTLCWWSLKEVRGLERTLLP